MDQKENILCRSVVQSQPTGLQTDEKRRTRRILLETAHPYFAIARFTIEVLVDDSFVIQLLSEFLNTRAHEPVGKT